MPGPKSRLAKGALEFIEGFDPRTFYHGTKSDEIKKFNRDSYFTSDPGEAEDYATGVALAQEPELTGANVLPVRLKTDNLFDPDNQSDIDLLEEYADQYGMSADDFDVHEAAWGFIDEEFRRILQDAGFDGAIGRSGKLVNAVLFNPSGNVRSIFAKFDPKKSKSGDILASGLLGAGALNELVNE